MNRTRLTWLAAVSVLASGCIATPHPNSTALPPAAHPTATQLSCPAGYESYVDSQLGFSACSPQGWSVQSEVSDNATGQVEFAAPMADDSGGKDLRIIQVRVSAGTAASSDEEALQSIAMQLMTLQSKRGREIAPLAAIEIDGRKAVKDSYDVNLTLTEGKVELRGWLVAFPADGRLWQIIVAGVPEYRDEVEEIYTQLIPHFHVFPQNRG